MTFVSSETTVKHAAKLYKIKRNKKHTGSAKQLFLLKNALKKSTKNFLKFLFLFERTIFPVNNGK